MKTLKEQNQETEYSSEYIFQDGLRKVSPYYFMYNTFAKGRWLNKSILSVFQKEFQDRPPAYYRAAIESGRITVNGKKVTIDYIFKNSDKVCHPIHRHEPPVSDKPVKIIYIDDDVLIVDKPSSLPVHPTGRYHLNTLMKITAHQTQVESINGITLNSNELYPINRLDRLTSGLVLFARNKDTSAKLSESMRSREIKKTYLCRVRGNFPDTEIICNKKIKVVSFKVSIHCVSEDDDAKPCLTRFTKISFNGTTSLIMAKPETGRTHQIRVHLQYLGYPIANDPIYGSWRIFQDVATKGGEILDIESMLNRFYDLIPTVSSTEFENSDSIDYLLACTECKNLRMDPTPDQLLIYLHALKYEGDGWEYETDYPYWADEQYKGDLVLKDRFWKFGGLWDGKSCGEIEG